MRLNQFLAHAGIASRRHADDLIKGGLVKVNDKIVKKVGTQIDPDSDSILYQNKPVELQQFVYYLYNKPVGVVSTTSDPASRPTVIKDLPQGTRLYPVGRLDTDSQGLVLLTNDGELTYKLTHPQFHIPKSYLVTISGSLTDSKLKLLSGGVPLSDGITAPTEIALLWRRPKKSKFKITLHEGRNRQIRRMCTHVGLQVDSLTRISLGPLNLDNLPHGDFRLLTQKEIDLLHQLTQAK